MLTGPYFNLQRLRFGCFSSGLLLLLFLLILEFTKIHYFCNRGHRIWAYFNQIKPLFARSGKSIFKKECAEVSCPFLNNPKLPGAYLVVYAYFLQVFLCLGF